MKYLLLFSILVFAVSLNLAAEEKVNYAKYCEDLPRRECRSRGRRCKTFMKSVFKAMQPGDIFTHCSEKLNIPEEKREGVMKAMAMAFWHGVDSHLKEMTPAEVQTVFKYQNCTFSMDGLMNGDSTFNIEVFKDRLANAIKKQVAIPNPQFRESMLQALESCDPESIDDDMKDCLLPTCIKNVDVGGDGGAAPTA